MRKILLVVLLLINTLFAMSDKELAKSIDLAGKQRMLTQKMSKEAMLIKIGIDIDKNVNKLKKSSALFDKTLKGLMHGDKELGLVATDNKDIQSKLTEVEKLWQPFYKKIEDIYSFGNLTDNTFKYIEEHNLKLLEKMNEAVGLYAKLGNNSSSKLKMANDINLAGKQRMLTQKIGKDLLFYQTGLDAKKALNSLKKSMVLFDKTIKGLKNGDKSLKLHGTNLPKILKQLDVANNSWQECKPLIIKAIKKKNDQSVTTKTIDCLDRTKNEMNKAVVLYTKSLNRQKQVMKLNALIGSFLSKKSNSKHLINLAGKQRMLTQRITKLTIECRLHLLPQSCENLDKYIKLYDKTLKGFLNGDKELKLEPVKSKLAIEQIKKIESLWKPFKEATQKIRKSNGKDEQAVKYVLDNNIKLLKESNKLVSILEKENGKALSYIEKAQLKIVNLAGRQRMLTQKMTKEKLAILNLKLTDYNKKLKKSVILFNSTLNGLINGSKELELPKVTNNAIKEQLLKVKSIWEKLEPFYNKDSLSKKELILLLKANPILLKEMDKAVKLVEQSTDY
jgi:hypothetical protein